MILNEKEITIPRNYNQIFKYFSDKISEHLTKDEIPVRFVITKTDEDNFHCELGVFTDFIVVLATETNLDNTYGLVGILSYIWFAPVMVLALYIGAELLLPKKKWYLMTIIIIICIVFVILFFMDPMGTFNFVPPTVLGESLIDYNVNILTPAGIIMAILLLAVLILLGFGFLIKSIQSTGVLRKKFLFLSLGAICFCIFGLLEGLTAPGDIVMVIIVRIGYLISFWLMYYGLKD